MSDVVILTNQAVAFPVPSPWPYLCTPPGGTSRPCHRPLTALPLRGPRHRQDTASDVMQQHLRRRASIDQSAAMMRARSPGSPMTPSNGGTAGTFPRAGGPRSLTRLRSDPDDTENLNPEEVYRWEHARRPGGGGGAIGRVG